MKTEKSLNLLLKEFIKDSEIKVENNEITPLNERFESRIRGGRMDTNNTCDNRGCNNISCSNKNCTNDSGSNTTCTNTGCSNSGCVI